jgi:hypothetical protein
MGFFSKGNCDVSFNLTEDRWRYWLQLPGWNAGEALFLLLGFDPDALYSCQSEGEHLMFEPGSIGYALESHFCRVLFIDKMDFANLHSSNRRLPVAWISAAKQVPKFEPKYIYNLADDRRCEQPTSGQDDSGSKLDIDSATFERLKKVIAAFPDRYPEYKSKPPKLDDDVRPWMKESGFAENEAERRVFGAIVREHFKLFPTP